MAPNANRPASLCKVAALAMSFALVGCTGELGGTDEAESRFSSSDDTTCPAEGPDPGGPGSPVDPFVFVVRVTPGAQCEAPAAGTDDALPSDAILSAAPQEVPPAPSGSSRFAQSAAAACLQGALPAAGCLAVLDGPLPVGDLIAGGLLIGASGWAAYLWLTEPAAKQRDLCPVSVDQPVKARICQTARGRVAHTGVEEAARELMRRQNLPDICAALEILMKQATTSQERLKVKATQKQYNCRQHRS